MLKKNFFHDRGQKDSGFIRIVLIVVAALVLLKYIYSVDVVGFLTEGRFRELLDRFYGLGAQGWENYKDVILKVWDYISNFIKNLLGRA